jgi:mono/diheme cytochrome c family protein
MRWMAWTMLGLALLAGPLAAGQGSGNPRGGLLIARQFCSECHAVERGQMTSPHARAPSFQKVANAPGMTAVDLRVWFESSHPSMPNLALNDKDSEDLAAYILSLKGRS